MYNTKTKNTSFINMWRYLQEINVENNIFMLELKDESLIDFDTEYLSTCGQGKRDDIINRLYEECRNNIWFFFREVIRIGVPLMEYTRNYAYCSRFILTPDSMRMIYLYEHNRDFLFLKKERQLGNTTTINLLELYDLIFNNRNDYSSYTVNIMGDKNSISLDNKNMENLININYRIFPVYNTENAVNISSQDTINELAKLDKGVTRPYFVHLYEKSSELLIWLIFKRKFENSCFNNKLYITTDFVSDGSNPIIYEDNNSKFLARLLTIYLADKDDEMDKIIFDNLDTLNEEKIIIL